MKKILLASAGLLAIGTCAAQAAEPVKLSIGGSMTEWVAFGTNKATAGDLVEFDEQHLAKIVFKGETKLDNGLSVGVTVDTNASQGVDSRTRLPGNHNVNRAYLTLTSAYGQVVAGQNDNVGALFHVSAPDVGGVGSQDGYWMDFVMAAGNHHDTWQRTFVGEDRSTEKLTYITPAFYGVQLGASYVPDVNRANSGNLGQAPMGSDLYVIGLSANNSIGPVGLKADASYVQANGDEGTLSSFYAYQGGLQASYGAFTLGGSVLYRGSDGDSLAKVNTQEGTSFDIGVSYVVAPYGVSASYFEGNAKSASGVSAHDASKVWTLAGSYDVGPGITWKNSIMYIDYTSGANVATDENKGWLAVTALTVDF